jgi:hypothetical protein
MHGIAGAARHGRVAVMAHERTWNCVACMHGHGRGGQASATDENATPNRWHGMVVLR